MKKLYFLILSFSLTLSSSAEYRFNYGYSLVDIGEVKEDSALYPAYMFMMAFRNDEPHKALEYITEEVLYEKDFYDSNFYDDFKEIYTDGDYSQPEKVEIVFSKKSGGARILIRVPARKGVVKSRSASFHLKKINGKYMIYYIAL